MWKLLNEMEPARKDIMVLFEEDGCKVWIDWVVPNLTKRAAETLKSYLNSLQMFVINKGSRLNLSPIPTTVKAILEELLASLKGWRRTITKETSSARYPKILNETERYANLKAVYLNPLRPNRTNLYDSTRGLQNVGLLRLAFWD